MSKQEEVRARIIAAEAARAALINPTGVPKKKPRSNWAASPPVAPNARRGPKK